MAESKCNETLEFAVICVFKKNYQTISMLDYQRFR